MPLFRQKLAKTVADQPPWRSLRLQLLAQKCPWQRPKSQQRAQQRGAVTKAVTARGKNRVRQSVVKISAVKIRVGKNRVRRRLGLRVASRMTDVAEAM